MAYTENPNRCWACKHFKVMEDKSGKKGLPDHALTGFCTKHKISYDKICEDAGVWMGFACNALAIKDE